MRKNTESSRPRSAELDEYLSAVAAISFLDKVEIRNPEEARNVARLLRAAAESGDIHKRQYRGKLEAKAQALSEYLSLYRPDEEIKDEAEAAANQENGIAAIRARMIDYNSSIEDRYKATVELQTLMGVPLDKIVSSEKFKEYDDNNKREFEKNNVSKEEAEARLAETESLKEEDEVKVRDGLLNAQDKLKKATNNPPATRKSSERSSWDKTYSSGEKKPDKGIVENVKGWFRKMFGSSEKK